MIYGEDGRMEGPEAAGIPEGNEKWIRARVILMDTGPARVSGP